MTKRNERKIALNYIYLSKHHSGGKDQVGLNLLKGLQEMGVTKQMAVIFQAALKQMTSLCTCLMIT